MPDISCPTKPCCPVESSPLLGVSSEDTDVQNFIGMAWGTTLLPPGSECQQWPCYAQCDSQASQAVADRCAQALVQQCQNAGAVGNLSQSCTATFGDGTDFTVTVPDGTFFADTQDLADRLADSYACSLAWKKMPYGGA